MTQSTDFRSLEIAALVIEEGSMSAAGIRLGMTQSAISQAMKRAETQIRADLVYRDRRPLAPTEAGRVLAAHMREIGNRLERAIEEVRAAASMPERHDLRLGMVDSFAATVGPLLVRQLMDGSIALRMTAFSGLGPAQSETLIHHTIDAAITSEPFDDLDDVSRYNIFREPYVLVGPLKWADKVSGRPLRDILSEKNLIRYSARSHIGIQIERHLRRLKIDHPQRLSFDASDSLFAMVAGGVGVAITTPLCIMQGAFHRPGLAVVPLPSPGFSRQIALITRRGEFGTLGPRIAETAKELLRTRIIPQIIESIPWLKEIFDEFEEDKDKDDHS